MAQLATRGMTRLAVLYTLLIVLIIVAADLGRLPTRRILAIVPWFDKLCHFLLMGGLAFVINVALGARRYRWLGLGWLVGSLWLGLVVALEEISQLWLPGRAFELRDLAADFAGIVFFGGVAYWWVGRGSGETLPPVITATSVVPMTPGGGPEGGEA